MALLLSSAIAALVPSALLYLAGRRDRARAAWRPRPLCPNTGSGLHEHAFGPAKPCWREGFYEQRCTLAGCPVTRHRRLDHVPAEPVPVGQVQLGFTTRG